MKFSELVRLLEANGFSLLKEKGSIRYYGKSGAGQIDSCGLSWIKGSGGRPMIDLPYSLVVEATQDPDFFGFYSPELEGFTGVGHSIEDCLYRARWGMKEHVALLTQKNLPVPPVNANPTVTIRNEEPAAV